MSPRFLVFDISYYNLLFEINLSAQALVSPSRRTRHTQSFCSRILKESERINQIVNDKKT